MGPVEDAMSGMNNEDLAKMAIDRLWTMLTDERLKGLTPYEAARAIGLEHDPAKLVEARWDGPGVFPGR